MAYIPPHRRNSRGKEIAQSSTSNNDDQLHMMMSRYSRPSVTLESRRYNGGFRVEQIQPISKWFIVPIVYVDEDSQLARSFPLKLTECEFECESESESESRSEMFILGSDDLHPPTTDTNESDSDELGSGGKPTILVCKYYPREETGKPNIKMYEIPNKFVKSPWRSIVEEIQPDLVTSFEDLRAEMFSEGCEVITPSFIVKLGTNILHGLSLEEVRSSSVKTALSKLYRWHNNCMPDDELEFEREFKLNDVITQIGLDFTMEKEYYLVKVFDRYRKHANVTCKCNVNTISGELHLCKVELNQEPHLIIDISFVNKELDPKLMLYSKRILTTLTENDMHGLRTLVKSAIIDSREKGGLRWPVDNETMNDRYSVIAVWHKKSKGYKNSSMRLKLRHVDRFNFRNSSGEIRVEVVLEMTEINRKLRDAETKLSTVTAIVHDLIKMLWEHFM